MEEEYVTPTRLAQWLRVDYTTVMRWTRSGLLEVDRIREGKRNRHRIKKAAIDSLEKHSPSPFAK